MDVVPLCARMSEKSRFLIVFDFDYTMVDDNTDRVVQVIGNSGQLPKELKSVARTDGWTAFMQAVFAHLHSKSIVRSDYEAKLEEDLNLVDGMYECLEGIRELGGDIIIISDSNSFFIDHLLEKKEVKHLVDYIFTNPAEFAPDGSLRLSPYHLNTECHLSGINLCKGRVLDEFLKEKNASFAFLGYVGDGSNDFCPMLRLKESDLAFARSGENFAIASVIRQRAKEGLTLKAQVVWWNDGRDILTAIRERLANAS